MNPANLAHTYSIVAYDPELNQWGVAVQSRVFKVGAMVPWAEPGVGAVATQSLVEISYGPLGLNLMRAGKSAEQALQALLASDSQASVRQVAMVDAQGGIAVHTGENCIPAAGHKQGQHYSAQANLMESDVVWEAMAHAFETTAGDLAERMMVALEAAEAEGGDIRGKQSAALLVVSGQASDPPWSGRVFDIRVDDNPKPLVELRRLLTLARAYHHRGTAFEIVRNEKLTRAERIERARHEMAQAQTAAPELAADPEFLFMHALILATAGEVEAARPLLQQAIAFDSVWREIVPRFVQAGFLPNDPLLRKELS